jgi:serine kinase of HPr protein (carbohydrate metabolism regulator)
MSLPPTVHASAVLVGETGVLIRGEPGSGKSSLVLALLDGDPPARLVADDRVVLAVAGGRLVAAPPDSLSGLIEIRGQGIVRRPFVAPVIVRLVVDLVPALALPRLPGKDEARVVVAGIGLPRVFLVAGNSDLDVRVRNAIADLPGKSL